MANIREVAKLAGVSTSTVSLVLNNKKNVSQSMKQRVIEAAVRLGYQRNDTRMIDEVAVILPGIYSSFFPPLLSGIQDIAREYQLMVYLFDTNSNHDMEKRYVELCAKKGIKNIIIDSVCNVANEEEYFHFLKQDIRKSGTEKIVFIERKVNDEIISSVYVDNYHSSLEATQHLINMGRTKIVHIGGSTMFPHSQIRLRGFIDALENNSIAVSNHRLMTGDFSPSSGYKAIDELISKGIKFDAVFAANDQMAIGAMKRIKQEGLDIPDQVAVVGFDNLTVSSLVSPSLTTVQYPIYQLGYQSMKIIVDNSTNLSSRRIKLSTKLLIRQSTNNNIVPDWGLQF